jgi:hypothetical protein
MAITLGPNNIISNTDLRFRPGNTDYPLYYYTNGVRYTDKRPAFWAMGTVGWLYGNQVGNNAQWGSVFGWTSGGTGWGSYGFNNSQGRFYAPLTGRYYFYASTYHYNDNNSYEYMHFMFGKNGGIGFNNGRSPYSIYGHGSNYNHIDGDVHATNVQLNQGEYMTIQSPWNIGGNQRVYASHTLFCGCLVG